MALPLMRPLSSGLITAPPAEEVKDASEALSGTGERLERWAQAWEVLSELPERVG